MAGRWLDSDVVHNPTDGGGDCYPVPRRNFSVSSYSQHFAKKTIRLGNTKSNREKYVQVMPNSLAERILRFCAQGRNADNLLFEFKFYQEVYGTIETFSAFFNILLHLTPHSLRAGGATKRRLVGDNMVKIQEEGRWEHMKIAKSYVDVVFAHEQCDITRGKSAPPDP